MHHIEKTEARIDRFDARLLEGLAGEQNTLALQQTLPGVDLIGAAMLLVEIDTDMVAFGSVDRLAAQNYVDQCINCHGNPCSCFDLHWKGVGKPGELLFSCMS
jgi:hypothetical protein